MTNVINNFLDNNEFEKLIKMLSSEGLNWNFKNYQFFKDDAKGKIKCHRMICKNIKDFYNFKILEDKINLGNLDKINVKLITKSSILVDFPVEQNETPTMIFFLNTNDGFLEVDGIGKIACNENTIVHLPAKSLFFHSSCTDQDYKMYIELELKE